ncbi:hypothetical protein [Burkholderia sp. GS2Y]|uniref:Uncharacterized protein n=1 Tax=Burkholderia theae TaxID=3143496 RepID=A0ABU9WA08_9BURK
MRSVIAGKADRWRVVARICRAQSLERTMRDYRIDVVFKRAREKLRRAPPACRQDGGSGKGDAGVLPVRQKSNSEGEDFGCAWCVLGE